MQKWFKMENIKVISYETEICTPLVYKGNEYHDYGITILGDVFKKDSSGLWTNLEVKPSDKSTTPTQIKLDGLGRSVVNIYADTFNKSYQESAAIVKTRSGGHKSYTYYSKELNEISITLDEYKFIYYKSSGYIDIYFKNSLLSGDWGPEAIIESLEESIIPWSIHGSAPLYGINHKLAVSFVKGVDDPISEKILGYMEKQVIKLSEDNPSA